MTPTEIGRSRLGCLSCSTTRVAATEVLAALAPGPEILLRLATLGRPATRPVSRANGVLLKTAGQTQKKPQINRVPTS